jgi:hypothetical protein
MISSKTFIDYLKRQGFGPFLGVPCSFLKPFINYVIDRDDLDYLATNNEGEAVAQWRKWGSVGIIFVKLDSRTCPFLFFKLLFSSWAV